MYLSRADQKTFLLLSKSFNSLSRALVDKGLYFPLSGYSWQANTRREQCAEAVREHALQVLRNPASAPTVQELCLRSGVTTGYMVPFDQAEKQSVARRAHAGLSKCGQPEYLRCRLVRLHVCVCIVAVSFHC